MFPQRGDGKMLEFVTSRLILLRIAGDKSGLLRRLLAIHILLL